MISYTAKTGEKPPLTVTEIISKQFFGWIMALVDGVKIVSPDNDSSKSRSPHLQVRFLGHIN